MKNYVQNNLQKMTRVNLFELPDFVLHISNGKNPVILQLTDTQIIDASQKRFPTRIGNEEIGYWLPTRKNERCYNYLTEIITSVKPDLIIMTGDVVYGEFDDKGSSLTEFIEFMEKFEIPWAPVFGNHDNECTKGVDWPCQQSERATHCIFDQK